MKYTFIELCAGAGGLSSGLIKAGLDPLLLNAVPVELARRMGIQIVKYLKSIR